jgi:hypothetical protein
MDDFDLEERLMKLIEPITRAIVFEDCGNTSDWKDNTNLGIAVARALKPHIWQIVEDGRASLQAKVTGLREALERIKNWREESAAYTDSMNIPRRKMDEAQVIHIESEAERAIREFGQPPALAPENER